MTAILVPRVFYKRQFNWCHENGVFRQVPPLIQKHTLTLFRTALAFLAPLRLLGTGFMLVPIKLNLNCSLSFRPESSTKSLGIATHSPVLRPLCCSGLHAWGGNMLIPVGVCMCTCRQMSTCVLMCAEARDQGQASTLITH